MSEYIKREGVYPIAKKICDAIESDEFQRLNFGMRILDWIDDIPTAEVWPVVRCGECENWDRDWTPLNCEQEHFCPDIGKVTEKDFFCSYGEKRKVYQ